MNKAVIEIELRYSLKNQIGLDAFLTQCTFINKKRDIDVYFDNAERTLFQKGIFIRTRNDHSVEIKFNRDCVNNPLLEKQDYCEEYQFALPLQKVDQQRFNELVESLHLVGTNECSWAQFLQNNRFAPHYIVDKMRTTYQLHEFVVAVDTYLHRFCILLVLFAS